MLKYIVQAEKMNEVMVLLRRVLDIRITFFDLQESELQQFNIKQLSPFCSHFRTVSRKFRQQCAECDRAHLLAAKSAGNVHVYHCHAGLLEGIVPLHDHHGTYLGAIVFGQLRDKKKSYATRPACARKLLTQTRFSTEQEVYDIGSLLKYIGEYIINNEIIKYKNKPWVELLENYIPKHLNEKLTVSTLAQKIGRSPSFLSHNFPLEFGIPPKNYILEQKMKRAQTLLEEGYSVRNTAMNLGFYDEFHFSKKFKAHFGRSPVEFRQQ